MQVDIKTNVVTQLRQTFSHVARHIGGDKPASRYLEATLGLQPTANFHYKPLWQPEMELYDVRRTRLRMRDWYSFKDPRQFYYGAYTTARARQQEATEKHLDFVSKKGLLSCLSASSRDELVFALIPLRHLEWAANANNCYITGYGYGTAITQATMFHAMDRLGLAQHISRIGLLLDGNTGDSLQKGTALWIEHPSWQGLRRLAERLLVTRDWFELFVAQNLLLDGLVHPLLLQHYPQIMGAKLGPALPLVVEFMSVWYDETARWVDATIKTAAAESPENTALLRDWAVKWQRQVIDAVAPVVSTALGMQSPSIPESYTNALHSRIARLGLGLVESAA